MDNFNFLDNYIKTSEAKYLNDSHEIFKKIMTKFPLGFNRIDWQKVKGALTFNIGLNYPDSIEPIKNIVKQIFKEQKISDDIYFYVCFDGVTEGAIYMKLGLFIKYAHEILTTPQHTYVIPENANWCLNYTFENYLHFGYS